MLDPRCASTVQSAPAEVTKVTIPERSPRVGSGKGAVIAWVVTSRGGMLTTINIERDVDID
eukprot:810850-Prorocentrum_minimum.AAC.1